MKKIAKWMMVLAVMAMLLVAVAVPAAAESFDFEAAIEDFVPDAFNEHTLTVGQSEKARGAIWTTNGMAVCMTSDPQIVTIDDNGIVTAVGEGVAFVAVVSNHLNRVTRYTVLSADAVIEEEDSFEDHPFFSGSADDARETAWTFMKWALILLVCFVGGASLAFVIFVTVSTQHLSSRSMKKKELPSMNVSARTMIPTTALAVCTHCGTPLNGQAFCTQCGASSGANGTYVFPVGDGMRAKDFEKAVNEWLAENPYVTTCRLKIKTRNSLISPFVQRKFYVKSAVLEYTLSEQPRQYQLGVAFIYKFRLFGPIGYSEEKHVQSWKENNPACHVLSTHGGHLQHFGVRGGFYAQYYNYVLFKK